MLESPQLSNDEERLEDFFAYLTEDGFPCGVGERVKACRVYANADPTTRKKRLKTLLSPIFARSEADQLRFYDACDVFFADKRDADAPVIRQGERPLPVPPPPRKGSILRRVPKRWLKYCAVALAILAVGLLFAYFDVGTRIRDHWHPVNPPLVQPPVPVLPPSPGSRKVTKTVPYDRACKGMECVWEGNRGFLSLSPFGLCILAYAFARTKRWRRYRLLVRERLRKPPFTWTLVRFSPNLPGYRSVLNRTAEAMRLRLSSDLADLDVHRTIESTIRGAGFPAFRFRARKNAPEYLFLIEQRGPNDHFACWWAEVAASLRRLGVALNVYFYKGDLRRCYPQNSHTAVSSQYLFDALENQSVVLVGPGRDVLHRFSGEFYSWVDMSLIKRDRRVLMTPKASFEWNQVEHKVAASLPVVPARLENISAAVGAADAADRLRREAAELPSIPQGYFDETEEDSAGNPPSLTMFLDEDVFQWVCACAVYPQLEWGLTLQLGTVVDSCRRAARAKVFLSVDAIEDYNSAFTAIKLSGHECVRTGSIAKCDFFIGIGETGLVDSKKAAKENIPVLLLGSMRPSRLQAEIIRVLAERLRPPAGLIFAESKLLQLIRLPWFRDGGIPGQWRAWLVKLMRPDIATAVREYLIATMQSNRPPKGSFARDQQDLQIAANRYWLDPENLDRRSELEAAMESMAAVDVAEDSLLDGLRKDWAEGIADPPGLWWRRLRRTGTPFAAAGLAGLLLVGASVYRMPVKDTREETAYLPGPPVPDNKPADLPTCTSAETSSNTLTYLAEQYEAALTLPPGAATTARMNEIISAARGCARVAMSVPATVPILATFDTERDGLRIVALGLAEGAPAGNSHIAIEGIRNPRSAFEQYHALILAQALVGSMSAPEKTELLSALEGQIGKTITQGDFVSWTAAQNLLTSLTRPVPEIKPLTITKLGANPPRFQASGGTPPYRWSATGLPKGYALDASGRIKGSCAGQASTTYSVRVTDAASTSVRISAVANCPVVVTPPKPPDKLTLDKQTQLRKQQVLDVIAQLNAALQRKRPAEVKALWPNMSQMFQDSLRSPQVQMSLAAAGDVQFRQDKATVLCSLVIRTNLKQASATRQQAEVTLGNAGGHWSIEQLKVDPVRK